MHTEFTAAYKTNTMQIYLNEGRKLLKLATPLVFASLASMAISITDVLMMGWLGPTQLAAGAAVSDYYSIFFYFTAGVVAAISPMISQARGRKQTGEIRSITQHGFFLALALSIPGAFLVFHADMALGLIGVESVIIDYGTPYGNMMAITYFAMMAVIVMHYFLSAHDRSSIIFWATLGCLPINIVGNYTLMFGNFGFEAMGLAGAGIASALSAMTMFAILLIYALRDRELKQYRLLSDIKFVSKKHTLEIFRVGSPIAISNLGEYGVFLLSTVTIGVFGAEALAAHTVALRMAGVVFALPLGLAQAATIRIAFGIGENNKEHVLVSMRTGLLISLFSGFALLLFLLIFNQQIATWFLGTDVSQAIMMQAMLFMAILAISQPFDNIGAVGAGILRGFKDTRASMNYSLIAFWGISFCGGWSLAFFTGLQANGIWIGLATGSVIYGCVVGMRLYRLYRQEHLSLRMSQ